ncbi:sulfite exporter TauE/SafE family protein [Fictibacillus sp. Mic-4]|uniref:sulfite exporter TauE/SafE family protein n=1 Tax=Fictibacillus TaxID=1329200 RepID=UPI0004233060|nr:sulfite exporter TauE/SafE family protein [Fictibacillus gelatini]
MRKLIIFAFIGFLAQLIDGSLGMAYGLTSSSLLLAFSVSPAIASASVHMAEVVTTAASGVSHIRFGNVDRTIVLRLIVPGAIGAFVGACFLSNLPGSLIKPYVSIFLLILGIYILWRFMSKTAAKNEANSKPMSKKQYVLLGLIAGFFDSTGGGGWGPISTPVLLAKKTTPRKAVGSVDTSEFVVSLAATVGFIVSLGWEQVNWFWVLTLMLGGVIAAPIAAWLVRIMPSYLLGVLVGGLIIFTNVRTLVTTWNVPNPWLIYGIIITLWAAAVIYTVSTKSTVVRRETFQQDQ